MKFFDELLGQTSWRGIGTEKNSSYSHVKAGYLIGKILTDYGSLSVLEEKASLEELIWLQESVTPTVCESLGVSKMILKKKLEKL